MTPPLAKSEDRTGGKWKHAEGGDLWTEGPLSERSQKRPLSLEGEEQQILHPERPVVGPERRTKTRISEDRDLAALHRPMERLRYDTGSHALQTALVELRLAQDVEPKWCIPEDRLSLGAGERIQHRTVPAVSNLRLFQLGHPCPLVLQEPDHLLARGELHHPRTAQVPECQVGVSCGEPRQPAQRFHEVGIDSHRFVELAFRHLEVGPAEPVEAAKVGDPVAGQPLATTEVPR